MWEIDRQLIKAYKECYTNLLTEMKEGGDPDLSSMCVQETNALQNATGKAIAYYQDKNPQNQRERSLNFFNPHLPYF